MTLTIMFQSLIGTVQLFWRGVWNMTKFGRFQSLIGMVQPKSRCMIFFQMEKSHLFQSLLGTVQQQCLLRFMFSLYLISTVFQSFSPKKSVNLFIVNSRKALILLAFLFLSKIARRFTDFFTFDNLLFECPTLNFYRKPKI